MRTLIRRIRTWLESCRRANPAGCCGCGAKVVRYVYAGPWCGRTVPDDARCETCGPIPGNPVAVDYGRDVEITVGQMDDAVTVAVQASAPHDVPAAPHNPSFEDLARMGACGWTGGVPVFFHEGTDLTGTISDCPDGLANGWNTRHGEDWPYAYTCPHRTHETGTSGLAYADSDDAHGVTRLATTAGLTVGYLRALLQNLPAGTPVRVEDPSRPGPTPGSTAEHTVTGAATGMILHDGGDGVLLLIDPKPEPDGAQPTAEEFRAALLDHLQCAELQTLGLGPHDGAVLDLFRDLVGNFEIPEED